MNGTPLRLIDADDGFAVTVATIGPYVVIDLPNRTQVVGMDADAIADVLEGAVHELRAVQP